MSYVNTDNTILTNNTEKKLATKIFAALIFSHIIIWTILPLLARHSVTNDLAEALVWAQQLNWGYDKNPWLIGWLTKLGLLLTNGKSLVGYYFIQQALIGLGFWSIWQLGNRLFSPVQALISVAILEGCLYFSAYVQTCNDNFALFGFLSLTIYTFYIAIHEEKFWYWLIAGISLGLALMAKYSAIILVPSMLIYILSTPKTRASFTKPGLYCGALLCFLICLPNILWLAKNDFISWHYWLFRKDISTGSFFTYHFYYPIDFTIRTLENFVPCFLLFLLAWPLQLQSLKNRLDSYFLFLMGLFPIIIVICASVLLGWQLYWEWGTPFVSLWGLILVNYFRPIITKKSLYRFSIGVFITMFLIAASYYLINMRWQAGQGSADYPAPEIAQYLTNMWQKKFHTPLHYVAGSRYIAGSVAFYSKDKPKVFAEWTPLYSPGFNSREFKKYGGIFVHDGHYGTEVLPLSADYSNPALFPKIVLKKYPHLKILPIKIFPYYNNSKKHNVVKLLIGILPPQKYGKG